MKPSYLPGNNIVTNESLGLSNRLPEGWYIEFWIDEDGEPNLFQPDGKSLAFASKEDCQRAIDALAKRGYKSYEDMNGVDRNEIRRICCEALLW